MIRTHQGSLDVTVDQRRRFVKRPSLDDNSAKVIWSDREIFEMTSREYTLALATMTEKQFAEFKKKLGGGLETREEYVRHFVDHPFLEHRICSILGLKTEAEKKVEADLRSADAAEESARAAKESAAAAKESAELARRANILFAIALVISFAAFFVALYVALDKI